MITAFPFLSLQHYDGDIRDLELSFSFDEDVLGKVRNLPQGSIYFCHFFVCVNTVGFAILNVFLLLLGCNTSAHARRKRYTGH